MATTRVSLPHLLRRPPITTGTTFSPSQGPLHGVGDPSTTCAQTVGGVTGDLAHDYTLGDG
eukprot:4196826-Pyramimonas_sp.AAC.1